MLVGILGSSEDERKRAFTFYGLPAQSPCGPQPPIPYPGLSEVLGPMVHYGSDQGPLCAAVTALSASLPHQPSPRAAPH